jgi:hypothetical protein
MKIGFDARFWEDETRWPPDQPGHSFLLRAIKELGLAMFPDDWTGGEYLAIKPSFTGSWNSRPLGQLQGAKEALVENTKSAFDRLAMVIDQVVWSLQSGELISSLSLRSEPAHPLRPRRWLTERCGERFCQGQLSDSKGYLVHPPWIFVTRESLAVCIKNLMEPPKTGAAVGDQARSFRETDRVLVEEMHEIIKSRKAKSVQDAARQVVSRAEKLGTDESAVRRLQNAYGDKYPQRKRRARIARNTAV